MMAVGERLRDTAYLDLDPGQLPGLGLRRFLGFLVSTLQRSWANQEELITPLALEEPTIELAREARMKGEK